MEIDETIFKAYDVRGIYPTEVNEETAYLIGKAYAEYLKPKKIVVGRDIRRVSEKMEKELIRGLTDQGVDVYRIGPTTTEMLFFAVGHYEFDGGIAVTASHNPREYGGFKFVREKSIPVTENSGLKDVLKIIEDDLYSKSDKVGQVFEKDVLDDYKKFVLAFMDISKIKPCKVVFNPLGGAGGPIIEQILKELPIEIVWIDKEPDPELKKGDPNPLEPERREETIAKIKTEKVDFGVSWDGDGDRCFFFDENGDFVPAPFATALLTEYLSYDHPGSEIVIDSRGVWAIQDIADKVGIKVHLCKAGRTFLQQMLKEKEGYMAAELTAHYFFKDNWYSDNGIIPVLMMLDYLTRKNQKLSEIMRPIREKYFMADEIKLKTDNIEALFEKLKQAYPDGKESDLDGLTLDFPEWRFNLRGSNTEPVAKLNIESRSQEVLDLEKDKLLKVINT